VTGDASPVAPPGPAQRETGPDRGVAARWALLGLVVIFFVGSALHFTHELSGYQDWVGWFSAVNESAWEHLKMFYFPAVVLALVQHAFIRERVNNYWYGVGLGLLLVPTGVLLSFYFYLGILLPIQGRGTLVLDISTAVVGVVWAQWATYRAWTRPDRPSRAARTAVGVANVLLAGGMALFTFAPPEVFLFEDFYGYTYNDQFGVLETYEGREVFVDSDG
jgi:hypothetical protein